MNNYYVYEWIRLDTNEPFYVGKGKGDRWKVFYSRNNYFTYIVNKVPVAVNILHKNLNEEFAYGLECYYIWLYRDIIGYEMCNFNDGGEGNTSTHSEDTKRKISKSHKGIKQSEGSKRKISQALKGKNKSKEVKTKISKTLKGKYLGKENKHSKSVICLTTKRIFYTIRLANKFYNISEGGITKCCKGERKHCGKLSDGAKLVWRYIVWEHDKKYRVKNRKLGNNK